MAEDTTGREGRMNKPDPPAEAPLIRLVRLAATLTTQQAARKAGISKARWSQVENGYERKTDGLYYPVSGTDGLLARMARAIGLDADRLEDAGRGDAAAVLREMTAREHREEPPIPEDAPVCTFEESILSEDGISLETKSQLIRVHRAGRHANCRPLDEDESRLPRLMAR